MNAAMRLASVFLAVAFLASGCNRGGGGDAAEHSEKAGGEAAKPAVPAPGHSDASPTPAPGVTLSGKVHLIGQPPAPSVLKMDADAVCSKAHPDSPPVSQEVVVDASGNLANVFVFVRNGLEGKSFATPPSPVVLDQKGCMYTPHVLGMMVNQPLKMLNSDPTLHNIHAHPKVEGNKEFNLAMPRPGLEHTRTFTKEEIMIPVKCDVHPWMVSYIGVLVHPFFAVTDHNGSFKIPDLPAGTYTIETWHEKYGAQTQTLTVGATPTAELDFSYQAGGS